MLINQLWLRQNFSKAEIRMIEDGRGRWDHTEPLQMYHRKAAEYCLEHLERIAPPEAGDEAGLERLAHTWLEFFVHTSFLPNPVDYARVLLDRALHLIQLDRDQVILVCLHTLPTLLNASEPEHMRSLQILAPSLKKLGYKNEYADTLIQLYQLKCAQSGESSEDSLANALKVADALSLAERRVEERDYRLRVLQYFLDTKQLNQVWQLPDQLKKISLTYSDEQKSTDCETFFVQLIERVKKEYGEFSGLLIDVYSAFADFYKREKNTAKQKLIFLYMLDVHKQLVRQTASSEPFDHMDYHEKCIALGEHCQELERFDEALAVYEELVASWRAVVGADDDRLLYAEACAVDCSLRLVLPHATARFSQLVKAIEDKPFEPDPSIDFEDQTKLKSLNKLSSILHHLRKYKSIVVITYGWVRKLEAKLGEHHPALYMHLCTICEYTIRSNDFELAEVVLERARQIGAGFRLNDIRLALLKLYEGQLARKSR